jgi:uncharacterized CHY-type Zn-finger protein
MIKPTSNKTFEIICGRCKKKFNPSEKDQCPFCWTKEFKTLGDIPKHLYPNIDNNESIQRKSVG